MSNKQIKVEKKAAEAIKVRIEKERKRASIRWGAISGIVGLVTGAAGVAVPFLIFDMEGPKLGVYAMQSNMTVNVETDPTTGRPTVTDRNAKVDVIIVNTGRTSTTIASVALDGDGAVPMALCGGAREITIGESDAVALAFESGTNAVHVPEAVTVTYNDGHTDRITVTPADSADVVLAAHKAKIDEAEALCTL